MKKTIHSSILPNNLFQLTKLKVENKIKYVDSSVAFYQSTSDYYVQGSLKTGYEVQPDNKLATYAFVLYLLVS